MAKVRKSSCLVAIGVGQGDAFFLDKAGLTILIDGGRSAQGFPAQFQKVTKRESVDILVCTHNDADHACGVLGFLRSGLRCREVWLPGSWTDRLEDLLLRPESFTEELISNIEEIQVIPERRPSLQALGDRYAESIVHQERDYEGAATIDADALSEALEMAPDMETYGDMFWLYLPHPWLSEDWLDRWWELRWMFRQDHERFRLFVEALSAATRIREISLAAYHMGASIRWFEYDNGSYSENRSNRGGIPNYLEPINAREILRIRRRRWSALAFLALTTSNKQSLVFLSPADDEGPAILFTADSDLAFSQNIPWSDGMIITAPHHGAEANKNAYQRFARETRNKLDVIWVRSDGRFKTRPGKSYLNAHGDRYCTLCRGRNDPKQDVRFEVDSGKWRPDDSTKKCPALEDGSTKCS